MKIFIFLFLALTSLTPFSTKKKNSDVPVSSARSAVVMEINTGNIFYSHNSDLQRSVASISKIMTTIVAIENDDVNRIILIPPEIKKAVGSMIYINVGDQIRLKDLLYGLMLRSGNDAAVSIAIAVSGSLEDFVVLMNKKADDLGMTRSLFRNPHGLDEFDGGNISTAKDMAVLMSYSMHNPLFREIVGTKKYYAETAKMSWVNKHRLLGSYNLATGGKTGYTKIAKRTLVTTAKLDDTELVVVTLDCGNDFALHKHLLNNYFSIYQTKLLMVKGEQYYNNYKIFVSKDYYFSATPAFWKKSLFIIEINEEKLIAQFFIINNNQEKIKIGEEPAEKNKEQKKISFWQKIINFFKGLF